MKSRVSATLPQVPHGRMARGGRGLGAALLLACLALFLPATSWGAPDYRVQVTGSILPGEAVHNAVGPAPADDANIAEWAAAACDRIVGAYQAVGYDYARAWYSLTEEKLVWIFVDPGQVRVTFVGVGGVGAALFRASLNLPGSVFHKPTVERALEDLKQKYRLVNVSYRVKDLGESQITPFGRTVPERLLQIYVVSAEFLGASLDVSFDAIWGVVPAVSYLRAGLLFDDDRLFTRIVFAFPYRRYLTEEEPRLQLVRTGFDAAYRLRRLRGLLAPRLETSLYLSRYDRADLGIKTYDLLRSTTVPGLVLLLPALELSLGAGADVVSVSHLEPVADVPMAAPPTSDRSSVRALIRLVANVDPRAVVMQRDQRPWMHLQIDFASSDIQQWFISTALSGQKVIGAGRHRLIIRGRGVVMAGDVRFWDEMQLASDYQRVFFNNLYWVREATQVETAYQLRVWRDWFAVGAFHDASLFMDRSQPRHGVALVNAFGPSVHFLLFDTFSFNIYAGFGLAPVGFDHTVSFTLQTIF